MKAKIEKDLVFAVLAFGYLGNAAKVSLISIVELKPKVIYVLADKAGASWIREVLEPHTSIKIILLEPNEFDLHKLALSMDDVMANYSEFGQKRFIRLTAFKWDLIQRSLIDSNSNVIFSDLDVLWLSSPNIDFEVEDEAIVWAQDDTPDGASKPYYCTGIMFWRNSALSLTVLREMFHNQCENIIKGRDVPDEPTFNSTVRSLENLKRRTRSLNKDAFVIGHRFFFSFFNSNVDSMIAFHANYVTGEREKYQRLEAMRLRRIGHLSWLFFYFNSLGREVGKRIKTLSK